MRKENNFETKCYGIKKICKKEVESVLCWPSTALRVVCTPSEITISEEN